VIAENWPFSISLAGTVTNENQEQRETLKIENLAREAKFTLAFSQPKIELLICDQQPKQLHLLIY